MATKTGAVGTAGQDTLFKTPVSLGIQLGAGEYPNGTLSFTNIASGGTVWRNNHFTNSLAVWLCLCDSAGNNKVRIGTWNIGANSSSNLKDFTVSNAQALAGKALYLIMEDSGYDWDTRDYTCLRGNTAVSVNTAYQSFTISGIVGDGGSMSVSKQSATPGETITVTAVPDGGYSANTPTATGITFTAAGTNKWTFTMPAANVTINQTFTKLSYDVIVNAGDGGTAASNKAQASGGETVTITCTPNSGYSANTPTASGIIFTAAGTNKWTFTMPTGGRVAISCTFTKIDYTVSKTVTGSGTVSLSKTTANIGDEITITATPASGWKVKTITTSPSRTITNNKFTMPAGNVTVSVVFEKINYTVSVTTSGSGSATLSKNTANIGDEITVTPSPSSGWRVKSITTSPSRTVTNNKFTMPASDVTVTVTFEKITYTVTVSSGTGGTLTADKATAQVGDTVTLTRTANTGYAFSNWTKTPSDLSINASTLKFTMPAQNVSVKANFAIINYEVSISAGAGGTAALDSNVGTYGSTVTITASPNSGYKANTPTATGITFTAAGTNKWTFTMPAHAVAVSITFSKINYTLTGTKTGTGTLTLSKSTANIGDEITITATPGSGWRLKSLTTNPSRTITNNKFTMPAGNVTVSAVFEKINYTVSVTTSGSGSATLSKTTANIGDEITITATPASGWKVKTITTSPSRTITNNKFTMPAGNVTVSVVFEKINYTVTGTKTGTGTLTLSKTTAQIGDEITITATPGSGWRLKSLTTNPSRTITNNKFTMPAGNVTVTAVFEKISYTVSISKTPAAGGSVSLSKTTAQIGDEITLTATPATGYRVKSIVTNPSRTVSNNKFTMPAGNVAVTVTFELISYAVTKKISPSGGGTASLSKTSAHLGDTITVTPTPASGYQLKEIKTNPSRTISSNQFTMPAATVEVTIVFEKINYTVSKTITPSGSGKVTLSKTTAQIGDEITVTATPETGYRLKENGITTSPARTITNNKFTMPAGNVAVTVTFEKITYAITKTVTPTGAGTVTLSKTSAKMGETVTVSQTPASGYYFDGWETTPANLITNGQFTMPTQNVTVKAKYLKYSTARIGNKSLTSNSTVKLTISADKTSYKHKYKINFGEGMATDWLDVAAGVTEVNVSIPDSWADAIPNATSKTGGFLTVRTYKADGTTMIGYYTISGLTYNVRDDLKPTLTDITTSIARGSFANVGNYYVQGKCGVAISATADGVRSSKITKIESTLEGYSGESYNKTINNISNYSYLELDYTTGLLKIAGSLKITVKATDSRGRTVTKTKTITVTAYTKPKGTLDVWRVDAGGTTDPLGTYAKYTKTSSFTAVGSNSLTVTLKSQNVSKTNPANTGDLLPGSKQNFGQLSEYTIELKLQDAFETVTITAKLPTARFLFYAESAGDRLAFFKAANTSLSKNGKDTVLEFSEDSQIYIGTEMLETFLRWNIGAGIAPNGSDLNNLVEPGLYLLSSTYTFTNMPPNASAILVLKTARTWTGVLQIAFGIRSVYVRYRSNQNTWEAWNKIDNYGYGWQPTGTNIDNLIQPGTYGLSSNYTYTGLPEGETSGVLEVITPSYSEGYAMQIFRPTAAREYVRYRSASGGTVWGSWYKYTGTAV